MKALLLFVLAQAFLLAGAAAVAVTRWDVVSLSVVVETGGDKVTKTLLTARDYRVLVAQRDLASPSDFFVGYNETSHEIAVVRIKDGSLRYSIAYSLGTETEAASADRSVVAQVRPFYLSTLSLSCPGTLHDLLLRKANSALKSFKRTFIAGDTDHHLTITGSALSTGQRYQY